MIYFLHVPKTAGTSMRQFFASGLTQDEIAYIYLPPDGLELDELYALPRPRIEALKLLFGHYQYGVDARFQRPGNYVTCLRETAPRLTSNYRQHVRGGFVGNLSMLAYFNEWKPVDMDNYTVRLLAGIGHSLPFGSITEEHLRLAKRNLTEGFAAFGLYEYLPESISLFRQTLGLAESPIGEENVTPPSQRAEAIPESEITALVRHNALDEELYAYGRSKFFTQMPGRQAQSAA